MDAPFYTLLKIKHTTLVYTNLGNLGKYSKLNNYISFDSS